MRNFGAHLRVRYQEGRKAAQDGRRNCPYAKTTKEHQAWWKGYFDCRAGMTAEQVRESLALNEIEWRGGVKDAIHPRLLEEEPR